MALHDGPVGMILQRAARLWYAAELAADPTLPKNLTEGDIYALAIPRVRALFAGEVKWSETSPGDQAIWRGRPRRVALTPHWLESCWENYYDTIELDPIRCQRHDHQLFGPRNVGDNGQSNLLMACQVAGALTFDITQMYAEVSRDLSIHDQVLVELRIGPKSIVTARLHDVVLGVPIGRTVPQRCNFEVRIDFPIIADPLTVVMHLEGTVMRTVY